MTATFDLAPVPTTATIDGIPRTVVAAVFAPGRTGELDSHVVILRSFEGELFSVHWMIHDDDAQESRLAQGDYGLTYPEAVAELSRRLTTVRP